MSELPKIQDLTPEKMRVMCAEAEATLTDAEYTEFVHWLGKLESGNTCAIPSERAIFSAKAIRRLAAFLIAKGLAQP